MGLRKAGGNWVEGDRFFDREAEIEALMERVEDGTHTLVTAQRRMGKNKPRPGVAAAPQGRWKLRDDLCRS